jgi:endogenous inhibitor of DNA gyrase (YacG/DUF329 family)
MARARAEDLDWRFSSECPLCGQPGGWDGRLRNEAGFVELGMACPECGNAWFERDPAWQERFSRAPGPSHRPGAR